MKKAFALWGNKGRLYQVGKTWAQEVMDKRDVTWGLYEVCRRNPPICLLGISREKKKLPLDGERVQNPFNKYRGEPGKECGLRKAFQQKKCKEKKEGRHDSNMKGVGGTEKKVDSEKQKNRAPFQ